MSTENPYFHRGPIREPNYFLGRAQEVTSVLSLIKNNQSVSIVGPRRIGKTSFLLHISHSEVMAQHGLSPGKRIFVFIDCGGLNDLDQSGFYRLILEKTEDQLLDQGLDVELTIPDTLTYRQFERTLRRLSRQGLKLIYLLDEFELMSENHNLDADFFSGLRGLTRYMATGTSWGTPAYMSPEQAQGERGDEHCDIYSLGVILYELVTGHLPYEADTPFAILVKHMQEPVPSPRCLNPDLPPTVKQIIMKAMAKSPEERYSTAGELAEALIQACTGKDMAN